MRHAVVVVKLRGIQDGGLAVTNRQVNNWSARKGRLGVRFASARCLEIVCGTIATPTSARIVEQVTVGTRSACRTILRSFLVVVFLVAPDPVFRAWVPSRVHCSQQFRHTPNDPPGQQNGASTCLQFSSR
ncbi:uncharacterized protein TNCV_4159741 [Trichonephila clavipes]|nr:uncharacterized protein TNCV_4159741 [Trichonephila clavipes]